MINFKIVSFAFCILCIMINKRNSKTSIKLPRIAFSPAKTTDKLIKKTIKVEDNPQATLTAQSYGIYHSTLQPIVQWNQGTKREIASLTKMMTLLCSVRLCRKYKINLNKCYFRVTSTAASTRGTTAELECREWLTVHDLLHGLMLPSGNDAATTLAQNLGACIYYERLGQSHLLVDLKSLDLTEDTRNIKLYCEQFVKYMNLVAKQLRMKDTVYANPHGLDCAFKLQAYSILEDQAILAKSLLNYEECLQVLKKKQHSGQLKTISGKQVQIRTIRWENTNLLLKQEGFIGGKTGQTQFAGNCLVSFFQTQQKQILIIIVLGSATKQSRFAQTRILVDKYVKRKSMSVAK